MCQDKFATMVKDGNIVADILQSVPENKRPLLASMAEAFISGMIAQERLTSQEGVSNQRDRPA